MSAGEQRGEEMVPLQPRDYLILFSLVDGELHGHGILKSVESEAGGVVCDPANLYRSLRKLERQGLVVETDGSSHPTDDRHRRRYYALTAVGREAIVAEAARLVRLADAAKAKKLVPASEGT